MPKHLLTRSLLVALLCAPGAQAAPAPWFVWQSLPSGQRVCAQFTPGPAWRKADGPFRTLGACQPATRTPQP